MADGHAEKSLNSIYWDCWGVRISFKTKHTVYVTTPPPPQTEFSAADANNVMQPLKLVDVRAPSRGVFTWYSSQKWSKLLRLSQEAVLDGGCWKDDFWITATTGPAHKQAQLKKKRWKRIRRILRAYRPRSLRLLESPELFLHTAWDHRWAQLNCNLPFWLGSRVPFLQLLTEHADLTQPNTEDKQENKAITF